MAGFKRALELHLKTEAFQSSSGKNDLLRQIILGGQDGLVNVLGIILGVGKATGNSGIVLVSGLAAAFAESISMGAVAYTTSQAERDYYRAQEEKERREIEEIPEIEREEIRIIYRRKGFSGKTLTALVRKTTSDKELWLQTMMTEELGLSPEQGKINPVSEAAIVFFSSFVGSLVPILPFIILPLSYATALSISLTIMVLFVLGYFKGKLTTGSPILRGIELGAIGIASALAGYFIGALFQAPITVG